MFYKRLADYYQYVFPATPKTNFIQQVFPEKGNLLDAGCSDGRVAQGLSQEGFTVVGIDLSEDMIRVANKVSEEGPPFQVKHMNMLDAADHFF